MADAMAERGYVATTVADVLRGAGVSRETFYTQFSSKADCFMSAFEVAAGMLIADASEAQGARREPLDRFDAALRSYLEALAAEPAFARLFLIEVYAAGPAALERRAASQRLFADMLIAGFGASGEDERFACETLVAAISSMVTMHLATGEAAKLVDLHAPLMRVARKLMAGS